MGLGRPKCSEKIQIYIKIILKVLIKQLIQVYQAIIQRRYCFWKYIGNDITKDTAGGNGNSALVDHNWELIEQIPEPNIAFTYNAGPDGVWHSAPTTEMLLDNAVHTTGSHYF